MRLSKNRFLQGFGITVIVLAVVRCANPEIAKDKTPDISSINKTDTTLAENAEMAMAVEHKADTSAVYFSDGRNPFYNADGTEVKHKIFGVYKYSVSFPDENDVQLDAANKNGVVPVQNRGEAEKRKAELVYVGANPYFYVDRLRSSIPYLVPKASVLLQDIGRAYFDSLRVKRVPLHKIIVTSILRTKDDVAKLQQHNGNAKSNSAHLYGTTFDIAQNRFKTVEDPDGPRRRVVTNDTLKWILSEVLSDMRKSERCLIKYEVHQGCFHITVK
jgi:hypothetical protein